MKTLVFYKQWWELVCLRPDPGSNILSDPVFTLRFKISLKSNFSDSTYWLFLSKEKGRMWIWLGLNKVGIGSGMFFDIGSESSFLEGQIQIWFSSRSPDQGPVFSQRSDPDNILPDP